MTGLIEELTGQPGIAHHFVEGLTKTLHPRNKVKKRKTCFEKKGALHHLEGKAYLPGDVVCGGCQCGASNWQGGKSVGEKGAPL